MQSTLRAAPRQTEPVPFAKKTCRTRKTTEFSERRRSALRVGRIELAGLWSPVRNRRSPPAGVLAGACLLAATFASAQTNPCTPWPATDALGRKLPMPDEVGPPKPGRFVDMFYFLCNRRPAGAQADADGPNDVSRILARDPDMLTKPDSPLWKPSDMYYWGEPLYGYTATS